MLSDFEAALEAALIRGEIRSKDEIEEKKSEIKKIRRALEQLEGEPSEIVDI